MSDPRTVSAVLLDLLAAQGMDTCFGIPGVHNLGFWNALGPGRPRVVGVRHEQAAGYAADGMYRATGRPAAALLTSGPAVANVLAAFGEAYTAYSPMLVLGSDVGTGLRRPGVARGILHEMRDQAAMFAAFGAHARNTLTAAQAVDETRDALARTLTAPCRPAFVGIPADVLEQPWDGPVPHVPDVVRPPVDDGDLATLAGTIAASPRVVLWLGGGVVASGTEPAVRAMAHRLGAVVVTSFAGRGLLAGDPHLVDAPVHEPEVADLVASADLLLVLGSDLDAMNARNWRMPLPPRTAVVSLGEQVRHTIDWDHVVSADLRDALPALDAALTEAGVAPADAPPWEPAAAAYRGRVLDRLAADPRLDGAMALVAGVERGWAQEDAIVADMAVAGFWVALYAHHARPRRSQYPVGWGTLGYALPAAIGPASQGIPTLAVCGDGGPMFALGELATYAQESLPVTLLVVDDGGYGMLRFDQQVFGHPERGVDLLTPDWVALAASFGITGVTMTDPAQLPDLLRSAAEANRRGEPRLIVWEQRLFPPRTTSPRWFEPA